MSLLLYYSRPKEPVCLEVILRNAFTICSMLTSDRSHVFSDLRPYSCTFPICDAPMFDSKHAWFEHELSKHRCTWACPFCRQASQSDRRRGVDAPTFKSRNALAEHIHANHENQTADPDMLSAILDTSSVPETALPADSCPLCDEDWYSQVKHSYDADSAFVKMDAFRDHLGAHQEQLALFATSSNITGEESGNSDDTKSHNKAVCAYSIWQDSDQDAPRHHSQRSFAAIPTRC